MKDRHQIQPYPIRMPAALRSALEDAAKEGNRSLHAEIIGRLESSFSLPAKVNQLIESFRSVEAVHDEESSLTQRLIEMHEAQKAVSDLQQQIIEQLLKERDASAAPGSRENPIQDRSALIKHLAAAPTKKPDHSKPPPKKTTSKK